MYGALTVPDISSPSELVPMTGTDMVVMDNDSQGNDLQPMGPMESMFAIFEEIRDGINTLVELAYAGTSTKGADLNDTRDEGIAAADVEDIGEPDSQGNEGGGFKFPEIPKVGPKLGLALLLGGLAALMKFGDKLVPIIAPVLKAIKENILPNLIDVFKDFLEAASNLFTGIKEKVITIFGGKNPDGSDATILDRLTALGGIFTDFAGFILNIGNSLITNVLEMFGVNFEPYDSAGAYVLGKLNEMWQGVTGFFMDAKDFVVEGVTGVSDYVVQKTMAAFEGVATWFSETGTFLLEGATGIIDWIKGKLALPFEFLTDLFSFSEADATAGGLATKLIDILLLGPNLAINFLKGLFGFGGEDDIEDDELRTFSFGKLIVDTVKSAVDYVKELFTFDLPDVGEALKGAGDIMKNLLKTVLPSPDFLSFDTPSVTIFGKTFGGGTISLNPIPDSIYTAAGIDPKTGADIEVASDGEQTLVTGSSVDVQTIEPTNGAVLSEGSKEISNGNNTVVTTINTTDASNTNNTQNNTTQTGELSVNATDATAKTLTAMGHG